MTKRWTKPRKYAKPRPRRTELGVRCVHVRVCHACVPALGHAKWTPQSSSRRNLRLIVINLGPPGAPKAAYTFEGGTNLIRAIGSSQIARFRSLSLFRSFALSTRHAVPFCGHTCEATSNGWNCPRVASRSNSRSFSSRHQRHSLCVQEMFLPVSVCVSVCMCLKGHISGPKHPIAQSLLIFGGALPNLQKRAPISQH